MPTIVLDEPGKKIDLSDIDPGPPKNITKEEAQGKLKELSAEGKGILISSHILHEPGETCDSVVVLEKGQRIVSGSIADIQHSVRHEQAVSMRLLGDVAMAG